MILFMKKNKPIYLALLFLISFILVGSIYLYSASSPASNGDREYLITVNKGEGLNIVSQKLAENGIVKSAFYFKLYSRLRGLGAQIKAGDYKLNSSWPPSKILDILTKGDVVNQEREIKIIPGWNLKDIENYLTKNDFISTPDFKQIKEAKVGAWNFSFAKPDFLSDAPAEAGLEGYLFPDTYRIFIGASSEDIVKKLLSNFDKKLTLQMRQDISGQRRSIHEIIIMASIIEKEVNNLQDMKIVSDIFWKRLVNKYPLESCATLAYILGENKKQYSYEDTQVDSPFNTYRHAGLPPGPICNPSLAAIEAAIYPTSTSYHYFLSRPDTGETVFSRTYNEHLINKAKYLR
ncbi:MAG: putative aminodeoxychorismate lyase [Parcubacteria group bacterium ADurb.Bin316]|nr:MAG: putative aminodeoxychorismate lyase [Parcubacteria group bacterium ADurb.Bin316]